MHKLKLVSHNHKPVRGHRADVGIPRPYWTFYYSHDKRLGYDKTGRSSQEVSAITAATRKMLKEGFEHAEIYFENDKLCAVLTNSGNRIIIRYKRRYV